MENGRFVFFESHLGGLGQHMMIILGSYRKHVVDFLLVLIENFC